MMKIAFIDLEIDGKGRILDIGGVKNGLSFHSARIPEFADFVSDCDCLCGHNIIGHDIKYLKPFLRKEYIFIDTLYLSPPYFMISFRISRTICTSLSVPMCGFARYKISSGAPNATKFCRT